MDTDFLFINQEDIPLKLKTTSLIIAGALMGAAVMPAQASNEAMMDLLKVLHQKGTISDTDYELLANAAKADKEAGDAVAMKVEKAAKSTGSIKALEWAERIKIKGDLRIRNETQRDDAPGASSETNKNRLRYRARIGAYAQVNDNVKAGIRLVSGSEGDPTSTNQTFKDGFGNKGLHLDLAYVDWTPEALGGNTHFIGGKMKQPWMKVTDNVWDGDTNPEGIAVKSNFKFDGFSLVPSVGFYQLGDVDRTSLSDEFHLVHAQLGAKVGKKTKFGVSFYSLENSASVGNLVNGDPVADADLYEIFAQTRIPGTPVDIYGNWITNEDSKIDDDEKAWALGAKAKLGSYKLGYEYRDTEENAVIDVFDNSDFQDDSKGHILKASYKIDKNFSFGGTYFITEKQDDSNERDRLQVDFKAKF